MEFQEFNDTLAKLLRGLKRDAGVARIQQGYKGTGSQSARRQIFIRYPDDTCTDLWLEHGRVEFQGVISYGGIAKIPPMRHGENTPEQSYKAIVAALSAARNKEMAA